MSVIAFGAAAAHAAGTAAVRGADSVNVRRGPSPDSPAFSSLPRGSSVSVDKIVDGWALVTLANGQHGYVKAVFLDVPAGTERVATTSGTASATPATVPTVPPTTADAHGDAERAELLEREVAQMRERLAAIESAVATPVPVRPTPAAVGEVVAGQPPADESPHVAAALLPTAAAAPDPGEMGPSLALAGVGVLIGFLLGTVYGRRQERNRRSRVRF